MRRTAGTLIAACFVASATPAWAQGFEITPFGGYRFGNDLFETALGDPVDAEGAPAVGFAVNVPLGGEGSQFEGLFTHQQIDVLVPSLSGTLRVSHASVEHWQAGGLQEFDVGYGHVRPFLTGTLGLTRYAAADSEFRFSVGAGGGVKLFPSPHFGVRLDGRVYATFIDAHGTAVACAGGRCFVGLNLNVAWQAEFTTGLVFKIH